MRENVRWSLDAFSFSDLHEHMHLGVSVPDKAEPPYARGNIRARANAAEACEQPVWKSIGAKKSNDLIIRK